MFREDGCSVHLLVFGFTPEQFKEMDALRFDIYRLRDYIKAVVCRIPWRILLTALMVN